MFPGQKPAFGQTTTPGFFGNTTPSPFGQSSFVKPQTSGFGQAATFGGTGMFGTTNTTPGPFGAATQAPAFGGAVATTQSGFGGFSQPQQPTNLFGSPQTNNSTSMFGASNTAFNATAKPAFGVFGQTQQQQQQQLQQQPQQSSFFSTQPQQQQQQQPTGGLFGQMPSTSTGLFGSPAQAFGGQQPGGNGTIIAKYQPTIGTDTLMKGGTSNNVNTKLHCITSMKEYEAKSLEELRMEDYLENRKGPQPGFGAPAVGSGLFGQTQPSTGLFGQQQENKSLFGSNQNTLSGFGQPSTMLNTTNQPTLFNKPFSSATTTTASAAFGGFGTQNPVSSFGAKSFGQQPTTGLFGQAPTSSAPAFGQQATSAGFFASQTQPGASLFGAPAGDNKSAFGVQAPNTGFGNSFGAATNANTQQNNSLFGAKPATNFNMFGQQQQQQPTSIGGFGTLGQQNPSSGLFNSTTNKPPASSFSGFGTQVAAPLGGGGLLGNTNTSFFGSNSANKPGGLFGTTPAPAGGGLFGGGSSFGQLNTMGGFGQSSLAGGLSLGGSTAPAPQTSSVHEQIIALATSPYGDSSIFNSIKNNGFNEESLKSTNPNVLKNVLETTSNQFKISSKSGKMVKLLPIGDVLSKKSLFDGLEEYDSSIEDTLKLTPNSRRLIINKNKIPISNNKENNQNMIESRISLDKTSRSPVSHSTPAIVINNSNPSNRRESWLNSNAFDKVKQSTRVSDIGGSHENTILQFQSKDKIIRQSADLSEMLPRTKRNSSDSVIVLNNSALQLNSSLSTSLNTPGSNQNQTPDSTILKTHDVSHLSNIESNTRNSSPSRFTAHLSNESLLSTKSVLNESLEVANDNTFQLHPTGITLNRPGYYTIPSLDELFSYLKDDGSCIVPNFTVGREGYGNVFFNEEIDVAGLNLDEIVFFRNKEVIVYPDDNNKPTEGNGLNRKAQITLDQVWPYDKTINEPIKDPSRIASLDYESKLRNVCDKYNTRFVEYRPETGSWVFKVQHFSKYGLSDSDEDDDTVAKKAKMQLPDKMSVESGTIPKQSLSKLPINNPLTSITMDKSTEPLNLNQSKYSNDLSIEMRMDYTMDHANINKNLYFSTSPTADLATNIGTDCHKLQLMKASFFGDDDFDGRSTISEYGANRELFDQIVPMQSIIRKFQQRGSDNNSLSPNLQDFVGIESIPAEILSSKYIQHADSPQRKDERDAPPRLLFVKPKIAPIIIPGTVLPIEHSFILNKMRGQCLSDVALMHGRKFRVGWGAKNTFMILTTQNASRQNARQGDLEYVTHFANQFKGRENDDTSTTIVQQLQITSQRTHNDAFKRSIIGHLEIELENIISNNNEFCPYMKAGGDSESLEQHYNESRVIQNIDKSESYSVSVWALFLALWGDREELVNQEPTSHLTIITRRDLLSQWLEENTNFANSYNPAIKVDYLNHLINLLMSHKVADACEIAFKNDDLNLSMLLAQISGGPAIRKLITHQLASWQDVEADKFISPDRLKIFMLIGGIPTLSSKHVRINIYENLNWIKLMALHVWYLSSPTASIPDSLSNYEKTFQSENVIANKPVPPYMEYIEENEIKDLRYHLLQLYSRKSHPLEPLLNPNTYTSDPMDYRLSWLALQTLESIGYNHCSELSEAQIHMSFANQLETHGMWHWSIFVIQHIKNKNHREKAVQEMLYRYITISDDPEYLKKEEFVLRKLRISDKWINWTKSVRAGAICDYHEQIVYLIKAKLWLQAHDILMQHIVPDAIINDISYAKKFLDEFEDHSKIPDWSISGQLILDYIELNEKIELLKRLPEHDVETNWEALKPQISDLCSRISLFKCPTAKHRLCQSEISQKLACLVHGVLLKGDVDPCLVIKMSLEKLPLPQEYAQKELRVLLDRYVVDFLRQNMDS